MLTSTNCHRSFINMLTRQPIIESSISNVIKHFRCSHLYLNSMKNSNFILNSLIKPRRLALITNVYPNARESRKKTDPFWEFNNKNLIVSFSPKKMYIRLEIINYFPVTRCIFMKFSMLTITKPVDFSTKSLSLFFFSLVLSDYHYVLCMYASSALWVM